jgi:hypothetical protein
VSRAAKASLEGAGVITMGLAGNGVGSWDFALGVKESTG